MVGLTGLALTSAAALWGGQISEEVNDCMDVPCGMCGEVTGVEPALKLAPKRKELSRGLLDEPEDGEVGKGHLYERKQCKQNADGDGNDDGDGDGDNDG
jgi:hypothetical protein